MSMDIKEKSEFQLIDIMKLIAAFFVIGLHTRPFLSVNRLADNLYVYDIACYAVPFFYACTGYFIYQFSQRNHDRDLQIKKRIYKIFKIYVFWTIKVYACEVSENEEKTRVELTGLPDTDYTLCGSLCTVADVLVREVKLKKLELGDILEFGHCGAYSVTEAPALFLSRQLPAIYAYSKEYGYECLREHIPAAEINLGTIKY